MTSVKRDSVKSYLIEKVVPTIRAKCPQENAYKPKLVHQNNEKTHVDPRDIEFYQAAQKIWFWYSLNVSTCILSGFKYIGSRFFSVTCSLRYRSVARTIDDLLIVMEETFEMYPTK